MLTAVICSDDDHDFSPVTFRCMRCNMHKVDIGPQVGSGTPVYKDEPFTFRRQYVIVSSKDGAHAREIQTGGLYDGWLLTDDPKKRVQPAPQSLLSGRFDEPRDAFDDAAKRMGELATRVENTIIAIRAGLQAECVRAAAK